MAVKQVLAIAVSLTIHQAMADSPAGTGAMVDTLAPAVTVSHMANLPVERVAVLPIREQLKATQKEVPLHYNEHVQAYIDVYLGEKRRNYLCRMLGLAGYYFPIYERVFAETGLPEEIKYLSIVESALDPHAVSRMGATGPWQFMFATAKAFGLTIDNHMDERKDPVAASYAASAYLMDAYKEYGDWLLAIASYNCGKGNVNRAISRSGKVDPDFWTIRPFLPKETRNYVPAFIALTYVLTNHEQLGLVPDARHELISTETIFIDKQVPFAGIANALSLDVQQLAQLNPAYKKGMINGSPESPKRLIVPQVEKSAYSSLYAVLNGQPDQEYTELSLVEASVKPVEASVAYHKVKRGESLGSIAKKYRVEVQDLRAWNNIKRNSNVIVPGQKLKVFQEERTRSNSRTEKQATYVTYTVKRGDTLSHIANRYKGVTVSSIKAHNSLGNNSIRPGMVLRIMEN